MPGPRWTRTTRPSSSRCGGPVSPRRTSGRVCGRLPRSGHRVGPASDLPCSAMPPLITREEALRLGELEDHSDIEALVQRAWDARVAHFGDATDMCSLVNAKSVGCAEDAG